MTSQNNDRIITVLICLFAIVFGITIKLMPVYYYKRGQSYLKQQDYVKAYKNLKQACNLDKKNQNYRYYYVQSLSNLNPTIKVQKEMFLLSTDNIKDSAKLTATSIINDWRNNIYRTIGENYIEQAAFDKGIIRWDVNKFPLKIIIIDDTKSDQLPAYYNEEIINAFTQWQNSTQFIKFQQTNNVKDANIIVKIVPLPKDICSDNICKYVVGYTTPDFKGSTLKKMTIVLYDKDPFGNFFSDKELYNTILHEIGHSLGIMGHSYSSGDLMYMSNNNTSSNFYVPYKSSFQYLSAQDLNTIKLLYKLVPDITNTDIKKIDKKGLIYAPIVLGTSRELSSKKLEEAKNYIKNAPQLAGGYIDLGIAYAELNKYSESVKAFEKANTLVKNNNEKYIVLFNLAAVNLNNNNLKKALEYANQAKNISNTDDINELIMNINHAKKSHTKAFKININE